MLLEKLLKWGPNRGLSNRVGGGVITDLTGYVLRYTCVEYGLDLFSSVCNVDASIGGKNGIDVGVYKNMAGVIRQPSFLLHEYGFCEFIAAA